jgi:F-type H+-transporting ATPase subunit a
MVLPKPMTASMPGKIIRVDEHGHHDGSKPPLDFSVTKTVFGMLVAAVILLWLMLSLARTYKKAA